MVSGWMKKPLRHELILVRSRGRIQHIVAITGYYRWMRDEWDRTTKDTPLDNMSEYHYQIHDYLEDYT